MGQRWLTWVVALLIIFGFTAVVVVFLTQGDGPPDYSTAMGVKGTQPGQFDTPAGVAVDSGGNLFVSDTNNSRIQRLDPDGKLIHMWGDPGSKEGRCFAGALRLQISDEDVLWVADTDNNRLQAFDSKGGFVQEVGSLGQGPGQFARPIGLAFDPSGNLWVADSGNHRIQKFAPGMKSVLAVIPDKDAEASSEVGKFNEPWGVACDATGTVYVADTMNHRIQRFNKDGTKLSHFGTPGHGPDEFNMPTDLLIDREGNLYIVDTGNNRIKKHDAQGKFICEWGKQGANAREFNAPQQICEANDGTIYIADSGNHRVQKYTPRKPIFFQAEHDTQIPTKPRAPQGTETPVTGLPEVPSDEPTASGTPRPGRPTPAATPAGATPEPEPTKF